MFLDGLNLCQDLDPSLFELQFFTFEEDLLMTCFRETVEMCT
jgi:hypothetical protein